jgi:hypothetical protein
MFRLVDEFEVDEKFKDRIYERHQFTLKIDDKRYKGDFYDGDIHWLNPHPKQDLGETRVKAVEREVHALLGDHGVKSHTDDMEVNVLFSDGHQEVHEFKLKIGDENFKGLFRNDEIEWFHPKPTQKITDVRVEKVEEEVKEKIKDQMKDDE